MKGTNYWRKICKIRSERWRSGHVILPTFRISGPHPYLGNGWS